MTSSLFKKASKSMARAKIALTGPSGAGKTFSALLLAKGLTRDGRVAVCDTENASAGLYADKFRKADGSPWEYDVATMNPPYTAQKYLKVLEEARAAGYECLIIDSLTHAWAGEGGLLQQKDALDSRGGNSYTNWASITKLHEELKSKILHSPMHVIATMRSKQDYVMETNDKGKSVPKKVGLAPIQRDGLEYEFTVVFDIGMDHQFIATKDRTDLFDGVVSRVTQETGGAIRDWLSDDVSFQRPETVAAARAEVAAPEAEPERMQLNDEGTKAILKQSQERMEAHQERLLSHSTLSDSGHKPGVHTVSKIAKQAAAKKVVRPPAPAAAPADPDPFPAPTAEELAAFDQAMEPGQYVIGFGTQMGIQGQKIKDVPHNLLRLALDWARKQQNSNSNTLPVIRDYIANCEAFLAANPDGQ